MTALLPVITGDHQMECSCLIHNPTVPRKHDVGFLLSAWKTDVSPQTLAD